MDQGDTMTIPSADTTVLASKRKHITDDSAPSSHPAKRPRSSSASHQQLLATLQPLAGTLTILERKYSVLSLSILSSSKIAKRVDTALTHLGRFHPWDMTVLPGIVLLHARSSTANKLVTVSETVRRRVHEAEQKWWQYNRVYEVAAPAPTAAKGDVIEETVLGSNGAGDTVRSGDGGGGQDDDDNYFEPGPAEEPTVFERAVLGEQEPRMVAYLAVILSRVPIPELKASDGVTMQSNEEYIDYLRKKKASLVA